MEPIQENELQELAFSTGLSQERLRELLHYDPLTGIFVWRQTYHSKAKEGDVAGSWSGTYFRINIGGISYYLHVLAWFYVYGVWRLVDHKDRDTSNNTLDNLREATKQQNLWNQGVRCTNLLGVKGVQKRGRRFRAYITVDYQTLHIGTYDTLEEAIYARTSAAKRHLGEFANG